MTTPENDKFLRLRALIGDEGLEQLHRSSVAIVGLGAVGSYATEALARSGVGHLPCVYSDEPMVITL